MQIQRIAPDGWERYRRIRLRALQDAPDAFGTTLQEAASRHEAAWREQLDALATFIAVLDRQDAGTARGAPDTSSPSNAFLIGMWVAPPYRGLGVGVQLIEAVCAWARAEGFSRLTLDVADDNKAAIDLYARMGFAETGERGTLPPPRTHILEHRRVFLL
ncbi:MAG: GNAT family N-acetyltransferase [Pseudomonadota bacterium]